MGFLDRLFGKEEPERKQQSSQPNVQPANETFQSEDERAIARYHYLLKTAPPETIEQAHAEAFAKLTPQQRQLILQILSRDLPAVEQRAIQQIGDDPQLLARAATRAEIRQPGTIERVFGGMGTFGGSNYGLGGMLAGGFLSSLAGTVIGSYIAQQFFDNDQNFYNDNLSNFDATENRSAIDNDYASSDEYQNTNDYFNYSVDQSETETGISDFSDVGDSFDDIGGDFGGEL